MPIPTKRFAPGVFLLTLILSGCGVYQKYGYGRVVDSKLDPAEQTPVVLPVNAPSISQRFRPEKEPSKSDHRGFDILVPTGTPVLAPSDGVVSRVALSILYGKQVMVDHGIGAAGLRLQTRYFHLTERLVREGQAVRRGKLLGYSGMTGLAGGFPHLHFEVHRLGEAEPAIAVKVLDPQLFWVDGVGKITCYDKARSFPASPIALTYPVPCLGLDWQ